MLAITNAKNNLDRPLIKKLLLLGLIGAAVTGVGDFLLGYAEETPATRGTPYPCASAAGSSAAMRP